MVFGGVGCNLSDGRGVFGCFWVFFVLMYYLCVVLFFY